MNTLVAEHDTELSPDKQAEAFKSLSRAKHELASVLEKFNAQRNETESNEKRLVAARKDEQDLLAAEMDEQQQIVKLGQVVALQRLLDSRLEQGRNRLESSEGELRHAADEAYRHFGHALSTLRDARQAKNLARLMQLVNPEQRPWAESHALSFIRFASDLVPLDMLGDQAALMLRGGAVGKAAENLLMDIAKLEALAGGKSQ